MLTTILKAKIRFFDTNPVGKYVMTFIISNIVRLGLGTHLFVKVP